MKDATMASAATERALGIATLYGSAICRPVAAISSAVSLMDEYLEQPGRVFDSVKVERSGE